MRISMKPPPSALRLLRSLVSFKIRTKLIVAFFGIIFPFIILFGIIALYNVNNIRKATLRAETISGEMHAVMSLQIALDKALMPPNDYLITGNKKYIDDFKTASDAVEALFDNVDEALAVLKGMYLSEVKEEEEILKAVKTAWQHINEISQKILEVRDPVGNKAAATLMEELDYKWAYHAINLLDKHHEIDRKEYHEALEAVNRAWIWAWIIMLGGGLMLAAAGVLFAVYYSNIFVRPINVLHYGADKIATGDFKNRVEVKTGDELEQLSEAMNEMAAQLDSLYSNLEQKVEERTKELKESEAEKVAILSAIPDLIFRIARDGTFLDFKPARGLELYLPPEDVAWRAMQCVEAALKTGREQSFEYQMSFEGDSREYEARFISMKEQALVVVRDITERKKAEEKIKEHLDILERFQKVAVKREFRIKELRGRVEDLEEKLRKATGLSV